MVISGALLPDFLFDDFQDFESIYPNFPDMKFGVGQVDYYNSLLDGFGISMTPNPPRR